MERCISKHTRRAKHIIKPQAALIAECGFCFSQTTENTFLIGLLSKLKESYSRDFLKNPLPRHALAKCGEEDVA